MQSKARTVAAYLSEIPPDRRAALQAVRKVILDNLDKRGFEEGMGYGMIGYFVPKRVFPAGYHCDPKQPLPFANLASQKNHMALYMMSLYSGSSEPCAENPHATWFRDAWAKTGKKLDMGKACIRFKTLDDLALDVIGEAIRRVPAKLYVERYLTALHAQRSAKSSSAKASAGRKGSLKLRGGRRAGSVPARQK